MTSRSRLPEAANPAGLPRGGPVGWRRLKRPAALIALLLSGLGALGSTVGTVIAGWLAEGPTVRLLVFLALCVVGGAIVDAVGRIVWAGVVDRAEGRLRADLLEAALDQPLPVLADQAVGELLDRVDDDTNKLGSLARHQVWEVLRTLFATLPLWCVAGLTWWPAWFAFPLVGVVVWLLIRRLLPQITRLKVPVEVAWSDHAAVLEEGIAARDDVRTSAGQAYLIRRIAELAARVHRRVRRVVSKQAQAAARAGVALNAFLVAVVIAGVALAVDGDITVAALVTLFLVTSVFVGQVGEITRQVPELQAGLGALMRIRQLHEADGEHAGGLSAPVSAPALRLNDLSFSYGESFALRGVNLHLPAGQTLALVGRSGSGKTTITSLISRAQEPPPGAVTLDGVDVTEIDLTRLRAVVGVVTQRTELINGTLADNISLFQDVSADQIEAAVAELGLTVWVNNLPDGLQTMIGPGGLALSSGEEQLVAFARLLVRNVQVVILDEATARMDPWTEALVVQASGRLLSGRTGLLVAHRLTTTVRADRIAVMADGVVVQEGPRESVADVPGPFRELLDAANSAVEMSSIDERSSGPELAAQDRPGGRGGRVDHERPRAIGSVRRYGRPLVSRAVKRGVSLAGGVVRNFAVRPQWGLLAACCFVAVALVGVTGPLTAYLWGLIVQSLPGGALEVWWIVAMSVSILAAPLVMSWALFIYPSWWNEVLLRVRAAVLAGQTNQRRLRADSPGEIVARALDADRFVQYTDRWVDVLTGGVVVVVTMILASNPLAGLVLVAVLGLAAVVSLVGRPMAGRSATAAAAARAHFGRALVSVLDAARTVKLAAAVPAVRQYLRGVDERRVTAAVREHRIQAGLEGIPLILVQLGVVAAWAIYFAGGWDLATALLVSVAVVGVDYFGQTMIWAITEAPGTRAWQQATAAFAGGRDLLRLPNQVDLVEGKAPSPARTPGVQPLHRLELHELSAVHDDGTIGVEQVDLTIEQGQLVLLVGTIGSGKSSLLRSMAGLVDHAGELRWNGELVTEPELFLRPPHVGYVAQVPRVLSGTFADNIELDHDRDPEMAVSSARLDHDVRVAGGLDAIVGHRGVRLSGGQVQRLALARALATHSQLLIADDVSSALDAETELEVWESLRSQGITVVGSTSKAAALAKADRVVVLVEGRVAAQGSWRELAGRWAHLAG